MNYISFIFFTFMSVYSSAQIDASVILDEPINDYPEGIYHRFEDFLGMQPSMTKKVEARDLFKPKMRIDDPYIDNCYFYYGRSGKRVKDAFAISYRGSLYIQVQRIQKLLKKKDKKQKLDYKHSYIRVVDQGKYLFLEGYFRKGGGLGFSLGSGPISVGTGGPQEQLKGFVFDFNREIFDVFRDCKDFNNFLKDYHPNEQIECNSKYAPIQLVREIIFDINLEP